MMGLNDQLASKLPLRANDTLLSASNMCLDNMTISLQEVNTSGQKLVQHITSSKNHNLWILHVRLHRVNNQDILC